MWTSRVGSDARIDQLEVLRAVYPGSDHTRDVQNMIYSRKSIVDVQDYE